jgi:hypothetical protein
MGDATADAGMVRGRAGLFAGFDRNAMFGWLCILGFANGIANTVMTAWVRDGAAAAAADTFGISAIAWIAFVVCPAVLLRAPGRAMSGADWTAAALCVVLFMAPVGGASWVALTLLALHVLRGASGREDPSGQDGARRAAWILLATAGAMFWGRWVLSFVGAPLLDADAALVGWLVGVEHVGNTVRFADGYGWLWIAPACSSLANVSAAMLCWVMFGQPRRRVADMRGAATQVGWCLAACLAMVAINVARLALMVLHSDQFDVLHGPVGEAIANWISVVVLLAVCGLSARRNDGAGLDVLEA